MLQHLLIFRLLILNAIGVCLIIWGLTTGYVQQLVTGDTTGLPFVMGFLFLIGMGSIFVRASKVGRGLNSIKNCGSFDASKMAVKNSHIGAIGSWLVTLGLIGNIVGFAMAVSNVDVTGGSDAALQAIGAMMDGMKVAFYNTLIGTALGLWILVNYQLLSTATSLLEKDAAEAGALPAGAGE